MNQFLPGPKMIFIPGGTFRLDPHLSKLKRRVVTVDDFWMDETPVTVAQYREAVKAGACGPPLRPFGTDNAYNWNVEGRENHPVNYVDWHQACEYAKWAGKRLPTEDEWRWAARGGDEARLYPWGNEMPSDQLCWSGPGNDVGACNRQSTSPVGSYPDGNSKHGLKDMAGNVEEWTTGHQFGTPNIKVCLGGSWRETRPWQCQPVEANYHHALNSHNNIGFRCVRAA